MNTQKTGIRCLLTLGLAALVAVSGSANADDIEVFTNPNNTGVTPNLIFSVDLSASMDKAPDGTTSIPTRLEIVKQAMVQLLNDPQLPDVNVGFTYFRGSTGSGIKFPASSLDSAHVWRSCEGDGNNCKRSTDRHGECHERQWCDSDRQLHVRNRPIRSGRKPLFWGE